MTNFAKPSLCTYISLPGPFTGLSVQTSNRSRDHLDIPFSLSLHFPLKLLHRRRQSSQERRTMKIQMDSEVLPDVSAGSVILISDDTYWLVIGLPADLSVAA